MFCSKCGKKNADSAVFCRFCGSEMLPPDEEPSGSGSSAQALTPTQPAIESDGKKRLAAGWIVLLTLLGVAIVAGITWFAMLYFNGKVSFGGDSLPPASVQAETPQPTATPAVASSGNSGQVTPVPPVPDAPEVTPVPNTGDTADSNENSQNDGSESANLSQEEFFSRLTSTVWEFSHKADFSSGIEYSGIGSNDAYSNTYRIQFSFIESGIVAQTFIRIADGSTTSYTYDFTRSLRLVYTNFGDSIQHDGEYYDRGLMYYINTDGNLVIRWVLINSDGKAAFKLNWGEIYKPVTGGNKSSGIDTPDEWVPADLSSKQEFLNALCANSWQYSHTSDIPDADWDISSFEYYRGYTIVLIFEADGTLIEQFGASLGEAPAQYRYEFSLDTREVWVFVGDNAQYNGEFYDWWECFYINTYGNLCCRDYLSNRETSFPVGSVDVFTPVTDGIEF